MYRSKKEWHIWVLFILSLCIPSLCLVSRLGFNCEIVNLTNNVCYGYMAGFLFYLLCDFRKSTKQEFEDMSFISRDFHFILQNISDLERSIMRGHKIPNDCNEYLKLFLQCVISEKKQIEEGNIKIDYISLKPDKYRILVDKARYFHEEIYYLIHTRDKYVDPCVWELLRVLVEQIELHNFTHIDGENFYKEQDITQLVRNIWMIKAELPFVQNRLSNHKYTNYL